MLIIEEITHIIFQDKMCHNNLKSNSNKSLCLGFSTQDKNRILPDSSLQEKSFVTKYIQCCTPNCSKKIAVMSQANL